MTHSKTINLDKVCREADILIAAAGKPQLIDTSFCWQNQFGLSSTLNDLLP